MTRRLCIVKITSSLPKTQTSIQKTVWNPRYESTNASFDDVTAAEVLAGMNSMKLPGEEAMLDDGGSHHQKPLDDKGRHENSPKNSKSSRKSHGNMEDEDEDEQDDNGSDLDSDLDSDLVLPNWNKKLQNTFEEFGIPFEVPYKGNSTHNLHRINSHTPSPAFLNSAAKWMDTRLSLLSEITYQ
ncbi:hypothetical protein V5O48_017359, partial [Marasmius crinis-equi]